jgi:hypothetical protein
MIGADVVLVDGLLHQPHAECAGIEGHIAGGIGGNGGEVVNAGELHEVGPRAN